MCGIELDREGKSVVEGCIKRGLLINCTHGCVLRVMPGLGVSRKEIDQAVRILDQELGEIKP